MSDQIVGQLKRALASVEDASVPDDLRPVAFASAFWAARAGTPPAPSQAGPPSRTEKADLGAGPAAKISQKLGISAEDIEFAYEINGGEVVLAVPPSRLDSTKKDAIEQIVFVLAAGRQAAGLEIETAGRVLKAACDDCGREDSNFSRILGALHGEGLVVHGSGKARTAKVNRDGYERAAAIIGQLRGQGA